jgi:hypothetical protein
MRIANGREVNEATLRRLGVWAGVDPRTIARVLDGLSVKGIAGELARAAVARFGFAEPKIEEARRE